MKLYGLLVLVVILVFLGFGCQPTDACNTTSFVAMDQCVAAPAFYRTVVRTRSVYRAPLIRRFACDGDCANCPNRVVAAPVVAAPVVQTYYAAPVYRSVTRVRRVWFPRLFARRALVTGVCCH